MQPVREVYSLLMPVQDGRIIVPRAAVAEVMGYTKPKNRPDDAPEFVLGFIEWQSQQIPLVSFEAARGLGVPELGRRTRIAVVFGIAGRLKPDVFAIVTQGYPYLVRVNENVLQSEAMEQDDALVLARVRMANEKPYIPDLERLEGMIATGLGLGEAGDGAQGDEPRDELDALAAGDEEEFDAGLLEDGETGAEEDAGVEVNLGEITSFGTDTAHSEEMDVLTEALEGGSDNEPVDTEADEAASLDLGEVTAVGLDTNYSDELGELANALQEQGEEESPQDSDDAYSLDLSGLELEGDESTDAQSDDDGANESSDEASDSDDDIEFDISDLELDSGEDDEKEE